jgi:beta-mannosidase
VNSNRISRRRFLLTSTAITAAAGTAPLWLVAGEGGALGKRRMNLNGAWQVTRSGAEDWIPATVPGCVHTDLFAAGRIPDPFFRDNERSLQWIGETGWTFRCTFDVPQEILKLSRVLLQCEGLDTLATVRINGREIGRADNMFRSWEYDVKSALKPGANRIEISFASPLPLMNERQSQRALYEWRGPHEPAGRAWVRKEPCNFGWDWGPVLITCGIWRDISLFAFNGARLEDILILQDHSVAGKVRLQIEIRSETDGTALLNAVVRLSQSGQILQTCNVVQDGGRGQAAMEITEPKLWWPAGMGAQPLYEVSVELRNATSTVIDRTVRRIGLRTMKLLPKQGKDSLRFTVNGIPFFAKGANWIPADPFPNRVSSEALRSYVADAAAANMNFLRFWGGGYYEDDALFDACDEAGLCVWMDFKFACSSYPVFEADFMDTVRAEARDQVRRLRHHPCIAVWCGNNEISLMTGKKWSDKSMARSDYDKLFKELLGGQVKELAPQSEYVTGSPDCGDIHYWGVWHGGKPFEVYRELYGFLSEFGFQSFPVPKTVNTYTAPEDRGSVLSPVMQWHQRSGTDGNQRLRDMMLQYFRQPKDFESELWLTQMLQAYGIKMCAEHCRRSMPRSMGCMFWQYNDCWPVASWSSVDYYGRWKALHFLARRFYAPLLVSALEVPRRGAMEVFASSDLGQPCRGTVKWEVTDVAGSEILRGQVSVEMAPRRSAKVATLDLKREIRRHHLASLLVWLKLVVNEKTESENLVTFVRSKELDLADPELKTSVARAEQGFLVTVSATAPALWCWLELQGIDARYSDNFVNIAGGGSTSILVTPVVPTTEAELKKALRGRSLFDTYLHNSA